MSRGTLLLRLQLRSDPKMLCAVRGALGPLTEMLGLPAQDGRSIVLAVDEALTNVIRHAYLGRFDRPILISFRRGRMQPGSPPHDSLEILVVDRGVPLRQETLHGRRFDEIRPGGLGLHFIRECMDEVEFRHEKGVNYLRMVKVFKRARSHQEDEGEIECK